MKMLLLSALLLSGFPALASEYCEISFITEWSARREAPMFAKAMLRNKRILESKGYTYADMQDANARFHLDIHEHDSLEGKVIGTLSTPNGEYLNFTETNVGVENTVRKIFRRLPECVDRSL